MSMKRFEGKGGGAPSTRSGPRARAAQDRKFGPPRDTDRRDPYQRAERPPRADTRPPYQGFQQRLRAPTSGGIALDPDVARVFRDSESVNEALRLVIRLARSVSAGRPPYTRSGAPGSRPRSDYEPRRAPPARFARNERDTERPLPPRDARFDDSE